MQRIILFSLPVVLLLSGCSKLPISRYAASNVFKYEAEQPSIYFSNQELNIEGAWWWGSSSRAMPDPNFLPKEVRRLFRPISKEHGKVLFATFSKDQKKFNGRSSYVPVTKNDVRSYNRNSTDYYITVFVREKPFNQADKTYQTRGRGYNYEFQLFEATPVRKGKKWAVMQVIASYKEKYFTFACVIDQNHAKTDALLKYQAALFFEDAKTYLSELTLE